MINKRNQNNFHADARNSIESFLIDKIPEILKAYGLGEIRFFFRTMEKGEINPSVPKGGLLSISYEPIYKSAFILITNHAVKMDEDEEHEVIYSGLIHEIGHIVTNKLADLAYNRHSTMKDIDDTVEETTESIAQIVEKLLAKVKPDILKK